MNAAQFRARASVLQAVRAFLHSRGYLEVPTPSIVPSPALEEHLYALPAGGGFLRTSPEFALKKAAATGLPRIYEIGPCWRDREDGPWHAREFLMLEWYRAGASLPDLMDEVEGLVAAAADAVGARVGPWTRWTMREAFAHAGVDLDTLEPAPGDTWDDAFFKLLLDRVEPAFPPALFLRDWPASQAALAQIRTDPPRAERFEAYVNGVELANAFLEVIDGDEQQRRFDEAAAHRRANGDVPHPVDPELVAAVGHLPPTSGIALGIDRLVAVLCGWQGIRPGPSATR